MDSYKNTATPLKDLLFKDKTYVKYQYLKDKILLVTLYQ